MTEAGSWDSERSDLAVALASAQAGAEVVRATARRSVGLSFKADADPVTQADLLSEQAIIDSLSRLCPGDAIVTEEKRVDDPSDQGRVWLIDPLDGTTNYVHGFPWMAVSVALWIDNVPTVGVVVDITTGDRYTAVAGEGAWRNGSALEASGTDDLGSALVVTGFPYNRAERTAVCDTRFRRVLETAQGIRRLGAASLDLCMVASGRLDGYWEEDLSAWDMGAGVLMVLEAGGKVTDQAGDPVGTGSPFVVASNGLIHNHFLQTLAGNS